MQHALSSGFIVFLLMIGQSTRQWAQKNHKIQLVETESMTPRQQCKCGVILQFYRSYHSSISCMLYTFCPVHICQPQNVICIENRNPMRKLLAYIFIHKKMHWKNLNAAKTIRFNVEREQHYKKIALQPPAREKKLRNSMFA